MTAAPPQPKAWQPTPHPVIGMPTPEQLAALGAEDARALLEQREELIRLEKQDPYRHGYELTSWKRSDAHIEAMRQACPDEVLTMLVLGGNRSSKSDYAAKKIVKSLVAKPNARAWVLSQTESASVQTQMPYIWKYLPPEWKPSNTGKLKRGPTTNISYTQKTGFAGNSFVLPNGSQCVFKFYSSDVETVEGVELDIAWSDELVPIDWVNAVDFRLTTRAGLHLITFTPVKGYTPTVARYDEGSTTIEETDATELPLRDAAGRPAGYEKVPLVKQCRTQAARIVYFHTVENPYNNYQATAALARKNGRDGNDGILVRLYGVTSKRVAAQFPLFSDTVHLVDPADIPRRGTLYHVVDPCNGRNFFMAWALVDPASRIYILREWPQEDDYIPGVGYPGQWAQLCATGKRHDGEPGPAQDPFGLGLQSYVDEIARAEKAIARHLAGDAAAASSATDDETDPAHVAERIMDSRFGNTPTLAKSEATTLIDEFAELGLDFIPAGGEAQNEGISLVNNALAYDRDRPVDALNCPRLYIARTCTNIIFSLRNWTGRDGQKGASKDPVDVLRYLMLADPTFTDPTEMRTQGGGYL